MSHLQPTFIAKNKLKSKQSSSKGIATDWQRRDKDRRLNDAYQKTLVEHYTDATYLLVKQMSSSVTLSRFGRPR